MTDPNADLSDGLVEIVFVNIIIVKRNCLLITGIFLDNFKVKISPVILSKQSKKENMKPSSFKIDICRSFVSSIA